MINEALQENTTPSVGEILKNTRIIQGLTLEDIANSLCIGKRYLIQLEEDYEKLVCDVYTLGFLRSYAQYLGLDVKEMSEKFKTQTVSPSSHPLTFPTPLPRKGIPNLRILGFSLLLLLAVLIGWRWFGYSTLTPHPREGREEDAPLPEIKAKVEEPLPFQKPLPLFQDVSSVTEAAEPIKKPAPISPLSASPPSVFLKITEEAWIEIKDKEGNVILSRLFKPGENYEFKDPGNLILKTGNTRGTHLTSGKKMHLFSINGGAVQSNIPLDPEKWVEQRFETH